MRNPFFSITIDGTRIEHLVAEMTYEDCLQEDDLMRFSLKGLAPELLDTDLFVVGKELEIQFGYRGGIASPVRVMRISDIEVNYSKTCDVTIKAHDFGQLLKKQEGKKVWVNKTLSEIATAIAGTHGLDTSRIETTSLRHQNIPQGTRTDWELLQYLIEREENGSWQFYVKGRALVLEKIELDKNPTRTYTYGQDVVSFKPAYKEATQKSSAAQSTVLDPLTGKVTNISVDASNAKDQVLLGKYANDAADKRGAQGTTTPLYDANGKIIPNK